MLVARNHRVAVLAVDPSSGVSGGSILGDKTRMERLSVMESAYIRPSPSAGMLGGVAARTRETALVCEVAGFDIVILETVGVGQSEVAVADMVDVFALLQLPNAGDGLQAMKKGVMERADLIVVNKCDLDPLAASRAETEIAGALRALRAAGNPRHGAERGQPRIVQASALRATGIDRFWEEVRAFESAQRSSGEFDARRRRQALAWTWDCIQSQILAGFRGDPSVREALPATLRAVEEARLTPTAAARALVSLFRGRELES
jgi:LAO/AO transport system kinase